MAARRGKLGLGRRDGTAVAAGRRPQAPERARGAHAPGDEHKSTRDGQAPVAPVEEHAPPDELDVPPLIVPPVVQRSWVVAELLGKVRADEED